MSPHLNRFICVEILKNVTSPYLTYLCCNIKNVMQSWANRFGDPISLISNNFYHDQLQRNCQTPLCQCMGHHFIRSNMVDLPFKCAAYWDNFFVKKPQIRLVLISQLSWSSNKWRLLWIWLLHRFHYYIFSPSMKIVLYFYFKMYMKDRFIQNWQVSIKLLLLLLFYLCLLFLFYTLPTFPSSLFQFIKSSLKFILSTYKTIFSGWMEYMIYTYSSISNTIYLCNLLVMML